jgi:hypothetical protein
LSEHPSIQKPAVSSEHPSLTADAPTVEAQAEHVVKEIEQPDILTALTGLIAQFNKLEQMKRENLELEKEVLNLIKGKLTRAQLENIG